MVHGKRVVIAVSRGGTYEGTPASALEHQESWFKGVFGFMGLKDVEVIRAEGVAYGPEAREASLKAALDAAKALHAG